MRKVLALDCRARTATLEPGVRNLHVSEVAAPHGSSTPRSSSQ
jgi:glycolate oxidase